MDQLRWFLLLKWCNPSRRYRWTDTSCWLSMIKLTFLFLHYIHLLPARSYPGSWEINWQTRTVTTPKKPKSQIDRAKVKTVTLIVGISQQPLTHFNFTFLFLSSMLSNLSMWGHFLKLLNLRREGEKQQTKVNVGGGWYKRIYVTVWLRLRCFLLSLNIFWSRLSRPCQ